MKYGNLTLISFSHRDESSKAYWLCKCECNNEIEVRLDSLKTGNTKSCGCLKPRRREINPLFGTKFYRTFHLLKQRCSNPRNPRYHRYGARGIKCLWSSFNEFKNDMYKSFLIHEKLYPGRGTSIDRINNNGNYCKSNCRWATPKMQALNRSTNVKYHEQLQ